MKLADFAVSGGQLHKPGKVRHSRSEGEGAPNQSRLFFAGLAGLAGLARRVHANMWTLNSPEPLFLDRFRRKSSISPLTESM
jgi:hypothetical protein